MTKLGLNHFFVLFLVIKLASNLQQKTPAMSKSKRPLFTRIRYTCSGLSTLRIYTALKPATGRKCRFLWLLPQVKEHLRKQLSNLAVSVTHSV